MKKNPVKNRLMNAFLRGATTYSRIIKIEHFQPGTPSGSIDDFQPLVVYSLNKRRRWEYPENVENQQDNVKVLVFEREVNDLLDAWWCLNSNNFHDPFYFSRAINSNLLDAAKQEPKLIGYHIIRIPRNYTTIFSNKCIRNRGLRYPDFLGNCKSGHLKRWDKTIIEEDDDCEWEEEKEEEKENSENCKMSHGFYNLVDHIVVKKPRKIREKGWEII